MHALRSLSRSPRGLALLTWLALLLPVAQFAATWHVMSHAVSQVVTQVVTQVGDAADDKGAPHQAHCDLCVAAAAIGGGALIDEPASISHPPVGHESPQATIQSSWWVASAAAYLSRAPPFASV
jgi:predicted MFS family arabinose efflux permease